MDGQGGSKMPLQVFQSWKHKNDSNVICARYMYIVSLVINNSYMNQQDIITVESQKHLGLAFTNDLSWHENSNNIKNKSLASYE